MIYYGFFYFFELLLFFLSRNTLNRNNFALVAALWLSILFSGLRYYTGNDYPAYYQYFLDVDNIPGIIEPGFYLYCVLAKNIGLHPYLSFFIFSLATCVLIYLTCKRFYHSSYIYLLFILTPGLYLNSFSMPRQFLAVAIFVYSFATLLRKKNILNYYVLSIVAISFHYTAILPFSIGILAYYVNFKNVYYVRTIILIFTAIVIGRSGVVTALLPVLIQEGNKYEIYATWIDSESIYKLIIYALLSVILVIRSKHCNGSFEFRVMYNFWLVGMLLFYIFSSLSSITRLTYYFLFFYFPLVSHSLRFYNPIRKLMLSLFLLVVYLSATITAIYSDYSAFGYQNQASIWNYRWIME